MKVADLYELDIIFQYIPLGIYTREVDYPDVGVQVRYASRNRLEAEMDTCTASTACWPLQQEVLPTPRMALRLLG